MALTRRNAARNGLVDKVEVIQANVFDLLTDLAKEKGHPYDFIILDPPAFTKSRGHGEQRLHGATRRSI